MRPVLIVELDNEVAALLKTILVSDGLLPTHCDRLAQVRAQLREHQYALVISCDGLADGSFADIAREARGAGVPILALTTDLRRTAVLSRQGIDCVMRPFRIDVFRTTLQRVLAGVGGA